MKRVGEEVNQNEESDHHNTRNSHRRVIMSMKDCVNGKSRKKVAANSMCEKEGGGEGSYFYRWLRLGTSASKREAGMPFSFACKQGTKSKKDVGITKVGRRHGGMRGEASGRDRREEG